MSLAYLFLGISVITALNSHHKKLVWLLIIITNLFAISEGILHAGGLGSLILFTIISNSYFRFTNIPIIFRALLFMMLVSFIAGIAMHKIPGFSNLLVMNQVQITADACPFTMYLNFDKVMLGLILFVTSGLMISEKFMDWSSARQTLISTIFCCLVILIPVYISGYSHFEPKLSEWFWIWAFNNLIFVCFGEEVIFRGFLQTTLKNWLAPITSIPYLHVIIASLVFGLSHYQGGVMYILLASIAGGFYGYTYDKTNRLLTAMLVHFGLNLVHFLLFTYPASINMCG
jgi:uncharacterized protein